MLTLCSGYMRVKSSHTYIHIYLVYNIYTFMYQNKQVCLLVWLCGTWMSECVLGVVRGFSVLFFLFLLLVFLWVNLYRLYTVSMWIPRVPPKWFSPQTRTPSRTDKHTHTTTDAYTPEYIWTFANTSQTQATVLSSTTHTK